MSFNFATERPGVWNRTQEDLTSENATQKPAESKALDLGSQADAYETDCTSTGASEEPITTPVKKEETYSFQNTSTPAAPQRHRRLLKEELCPSLSTGAVCEYGVTCKFAHSPEELGTPVILYKSKMKLCKDFHVGGFCPDGDLCEFVHVQKKLTSYKMTGKKFEEDGLNYADTLSENLKVMRERDELLNGHLPSQAFLNFFRRPRLEVFKGIRKQVVEKKQEAAKRPKKQATRPKKEPQTWRRVC